MIAGIKVKIGPEEYIIPPLNLGAMIELQSRLASFRPGAMDGDSVALILECAYRALRRNYPDISKEALAENIDLSNMLEIMEAVMDVSGMKRKRAEEAEKPGEAEEMTMNSGGQM